jgi:hypothetical protein
MSLWSGVLSKKYGIREAQDLPYTSPGSLGYSHTAGGITGCMQTYDNGVPRTSTKSEEHQGTDRKDWDIYVLSEGTSFVVSGDGTPEDYPMSSDLSAMFTSSGKQESLSGTDQDGLNIPPMELLENSNVSYSTIPVSCNY